MPTQPYQHLLLTRFNVRIREFGTTTKNGELILSDEWLAHRFQLFEDFCFPSVKNQSSSAFKWLVFFDSGTPDIYKAKIKTFEKELANFAPVFVDHHEHMLEVLHRTIRSTGKSFLITSRLDNDDAVHRDYIDSVQRCFMAQEFCVIDFPDGYNLSIEKTIKLGRTHAPFNPFVSLIEAGDNPLSVFSMKHADWYKVKNILSIPGKRLWIQVIHKKNKVNAYQGNILSDYSILKNEFGIPARITQKFPPVNRLKLFFLNLLIIPFVIPFQKMVALKMRLKRK